MRYQDFEKSLDEDLGWRKKEISSLIIIAQTTPDEVIMKSLILLIYAHWEGYIKKSSKLYVKYICNKNVMVSELLSNFTAVYLKRTINNCFDTKNAQTLNNEISFIDQFLKIGQKKFKVTVNPEEDQEEGIINTQSNLNPKVLRNILSVIGLNYKQAIQIREKYINSNLLANRNCIGHGSRFDERNQDNFSLNFKDIRKLKDIIFLIVDNFRDELLEYAGKEYYLVSKSSEREVFEKKQEDLLEQDLKAVEIKYK